MTAQDILKIVATVAATQAVADLLANRLTFSKEPYQRACSALERARTKRDKVLASGGTNAEKHAKKVQRAEDDYAAAAAEVAKRHTPPQLFTSLVFVILFRILGTEYAGRIVAVLPFQPWGLLQRITMRGITIADELLVLPKGTGLGVEAAVQKVSDPTQACAFAFVYILCTFSVKWMVHKLLGVHPPRGADGGMSTLLDDPKSQKMMKGLGIDKEEMKAASFF